MRAPDTDAKASRSQADTPNARRKPSRTRRVDLAQDTERAGASTVGLADDSYGSPGGRRRFREDSEAPSEGGQSVVVRALGPHPIAVIAVSEGADRVGAGS